MRYANTCVIHLVRLVLSQMTKDIKEAGLPNQFNKTHQKDDLKSMNRPSKSHNDYNSEITETLKRINNLMKKII